MEHFLLSDTEKEELKQFTDAEAELPDMLNARERRVWVQEKLLAEYSGVLVSFTLNIPGPVKVLPYVPETFELALKEILQALSASGIPVLKRSLILDRTGPEAFLCVDADALDVKRLLVPLDVFTISTSSDGMGKRSPEVISENRDGPVCSADALQGSVPEAGHIPWRN